MQALTTKRRQGSWRTSRNPTWGRQTWTGCRLRRVWSLQHGRPEKSHQLPSLLKRSTWLAETGRPVPPVRASTLAITYWLKSLTAAPSSLAPSTLPRNSTVPFISPSMLPSRSAQRCASTYCSWEPMFPIRVFDKYPKMVVCVDFSCSEILI